MVRTSTKRKRVRAPVEAVPGVEALTRETWGSTERVGREVFGLDFYRDQLRVMEAVDRDGSRVAWAACHGGGKTLIQALCEVAFPCRYPEGICKDTATTYKQVKGQVWKEIHKLLMKAKRRHPGLGWPDAQRTFWYPDEESKAYRHCVGSSAEDESSYQGEHGEMLFSVNEAQAVGEYIFAAIDNNRAAGNIREFRVGNPTTTEGAFHRSFHEERNLWTAIRTTAYDTPNLMGLTAAGLLRMSDEELDVSPWPTVNRRWVREKLEAWGEDHPLYRIKVLAEFPQVDAYGLYAPSWLDHAEEDLEGYETKPVVVGLDPSGQGQDETAGYALQGGQVVGSLFTREEDSRGPVVAWLAGLGGPSKVAMVNGESVGVGYYLLKHVQDQGYTVRMFHPQHRPKNRERFDSRKDEVHWELRDALEAPSKGKARRIGGLRDEKTQAQLLTMRWGLTAAGLTAVESKTSREARRLLSPDRAEALIMANAGAQAEVIELFGPRGLNRLPREGDRDGDAEVYRPPLASLLRRQGSW